MVRTQVLTQQHISGTFKMKPLSACIRLAVAGGVLIGPVFPAYAELPIPAQAWVSMGLVAPPQITDNGSTMHIDQQSQNAVLNWDKFNVGSQNKVEFNQPNSNAVALNRILDGNPSNILGKVTANGQIYLYNPNGFVFGKDSTVNANTFVASTLNIAKETIETGLSQQSALGIDKPALGSEEGKLAAKVSADKIKVLVEKGAKIHAQGDGDNDGMVLLAGPNVENKGAISTNEFGQVILVASQDKVYLQPTDNESPFSGLLVEVDTGGKVDNVGDILVRQGNITLEGFAVNQGGRLTATTSVNVNGSIRLLAQEKHVNDGGKLYATQTTRDNEWVIGKDKDGKDITDGLGTKSKVTFNQGSTTAIIADTESKDTAIDNKAQAQSYMDVIGDQIEMKSGSAIVAPYGNINMVATHDLSVIDRNTNKVTLPTTPADSAKRGRILIDKDAVIDVSGMRGIKVAMERNVGEVSVQTNDLRDSPFQKGGVLQGQTIRVDVREDNPIVDTAGAKNGIQRTIEERLTQGGSVNLSANGDVVLNSGAVVNIAGGSVDYQDGYLNTTKLLTDYGKIVDISDADPNQHYVSVLGVVRREHKDFLGNLISTDVWENSALLGRGHFEQGYTEGKSAGQVNIQAPLLSWNASLIAGAVAGVNQRDVTDRPFGGSLSLNEQDGIGGRDYVSSQDVIFQAKGNSVAVSIDSPFPTQANGSAQNLVLSNALMNNSGLQKLLIKTKGSVQIAQSAAINIKSAGNPTLADSKSADGLGGNISLDAASFDVQGRVYAPGGNITLATNTSDTTLDNLGEIKLGKDAVLDVSGRWVNDYEQGFAATPTSGLPLDGGTVNLKANGDLTLAAGSHIKADGGAHLAMDNQLTEGKGGNINLAAVGFEFPSTVKLNGKLSAWGLSEGGGLGLTSGKITVGSEASNPNTGGVTPLVLAVKNGELAQFSDSGFSKISLNSHDDNLTVSAGTKLNLLAKNRQFNDGFNLQANANNIADITHTEVLPEHLRSPVDLHLSALDDVVLAKGSEIIGDTGAAVSLESSQGGVYVDGKISTPAGSIDLTINTQSEIYDASQAIWLGSHAQLLATGASKMNPVNALGQRTGDVLAGGEVNLTANRGYVIQEKGAVVDVSGTHAELDLPVAGGDTGITYQTKTIGSDAGTIKIAAGEGIVLQGTMKGNAGSKTNEKGRFDLSLRPDLRNFPSDNLFIPSNPKVIHVTQHTDDILKGQYQFGDKLDDFTDPAIPFEEDSLNGKAFVSSDLIRNGGFSDVSLTSPDEIRFVGDVKLAAQERLELVTQKVAWQADATGKGGQVQLDTAFLKAGWEGRTPNSAAFDAPLKSGAGKLTVNSRWTELVGSTRWDGFKRINLRSREDLRVRGVETLTTSPRGYQGGLMTAADLNLKASQIYPSTLTEFTFKVDKTVNPDGKITISGENTTDTPLSANGVLNFIAPIINQNGVVKAPFGTINFDASTRLSLGGNSLTSVSADGKTIPFGNTLGGLFWIYPWFDNNNLVFNAAAQGYRPIQTKQVNLTSPDVTLAKGSKIDISGGGDLKADEFIAGPGGSNDYLDLNSTAYQGGFAVVPSQTSALAPSEPARELEIAKNTANYDAHYADYYQVGKQVYLSGNDQLPAGTYTIMPARYALLPGAFLVTPQAGSQDQVLASSNTAGQAIVAGFIRNGSTGTRDSRTSSFLIESGADVRKRSEYKEVTANAFFTAQALANGSSVPLIPKDSGQVAIDEVNKLLIEGSINSTPATDSNGTGRGGKLDIATTNTIDVVNQLSVDGASNTLEIKADDLNNLNLDSLFLGGVRSRNNATGETNLAVKANAVTIGDGVKLSVKDMLIAAKNKVAVKSGAALTASGPVNTGDTVLNVENYGALLRVSSDQQVSLSDTSTRNATSGDLSIEKGAVISGLAAGTGSSLKSVLLDASKSTQLAGDIQMQGGSLSLNANAINMGEVDSTQTDALNLSNQQLSALRVDELLLNSRQGINFYGNVGQSDAQGNVLKENGVVKALQFDHLAINAAGFSGVANDGKAARLQADSLSIKNSGKGGAGEGTGHGQLDLLTNDYTQGAGQFAINGFDSVNITPASDSVSRFHVEGESTVTVSGDLNIKTDYLTAAGGADFNVNAQGHNIAVNTAGKTGEGIGSGFGASVSLNANAVNFNTTALLASGELSLIANQGNITVGDKANIDLSGKAVKFADAIEYTPGGTFNAEAKTGKITLAAGSKLDLSTGGGTAAGGQLVLKAPKQTIDLAGTIKATSGSAVVDMAQFTSATNFDAWMGKLAQIGINDSLYFRSRESDLVQAAGQTIKAHEVTLVADQGKIDLSGTVNTNNSQDAGSIKLYAGDTVTLRNGALLSAKSTQGKGGDVLLSSVDSDGDGISGINLQAGSSIDVSGSAANQGGDVILRALRDDQKTIKIAPMATNTVKGANNYYAEGVKKYTQDDISNGVIDANLIATIKDDTAAYMDANLTKINAIDKGIQLRAGVDIAYEGDLKIKDTWDFVDWRYGNDLAGNLVIRASGKLTVANSLTDAYRVGDFDQPKLQGGNSWSYQLVAGADMQGADDFATINTAGNDLLLQSSQNNPITIRTGVGDIKLAAGGDVVFKDQYATVYSAGRPTETKRYGSLGDYLNDPVSEYFTLFNTEYAVDGGDVTIKADNSIQGAVSDQFLTTWLLRSGDWGSNIDPNTRTATAWGVDVSQFQQNVGNFGGGTVTVTAGQNINDLSVMMPSTGKQKGDVFPGQTKDGFNPIFDNNDVDVAGGGQMTVKAGGDIAGGAYLLGKGDGHLSANGQIKGGKEFTAGPQLLMGDSRLQLDSKQDLSITAVSDAMSLSNERQFYSYTEDSGISIKSLSGDVHLGADTSIVLSKIGLDPVSSENRRETGLYPSALETTAFGGDIIIDEINLFPSSKSNVNLFANQNIRPHEESVNPGNIIMLDADLRLIATALTPKLAGESIVEPLTGHTPRIASSVDLLHKNDTQPARIVTQEGDIDNINVTLAKKAIIQAGRDLSNVRLDIQNINADDTTVLAAGRDIRYSVNLNEIGTLDVVTNLSADSMQISGPGNVLVKTGRNLDLGVSNGLLTVGNKYNSNLDSKGANITVLAGLNGHDPNYAGFISKYLTDYPADNNFTQVSGLITDFMRDRLNISDLSTKDALKLFSNLKQEDYAAIKGKLNDLILPVYQNNSQLSYQGISNENIIDSLKGTGDISYDVLIDKYLQHFAVAGSFNTVNSIVTDFMRGHTNNPDLTDAQALALFKTLDSDSYLSIQQKLNNALLPVYVNELKESGTATAINPDAGNDKAFTAINTLFPGSDLKTTDANFPWLGDVNLTFSTLQTVEGGNIDLLVPGGKVTAGLTFVFPGLTKQPSELGIIAQKQGDINAVVRDNFAVNLSRVFTQESGNIAIWSTEGDIDAGRGAKTALSVPETVVNYAGSGKKTIVRPAVSGSGVRAAASQTSLTGPGDVFLFAPGGVVDAGEAGIGGSNVTISAVAVLGSNNIQVGGVSTGVPSGSVGSLAAGLTGVGNLNASVSQIAQAVADTSQKDSADKGAEKPAKLGVLSVDFMGYGDDSSNNNKKNKPAS